jgi:hypothetical protein
MKLILESYIHQKARLPRGGRHILAQYDEDTIVVYQAYRPAIGVFAAENGYFGGEFLLTRMSWIKTSFLWMMYRSGWGAKAGQEVVLAVRLRRSAFDAILEQAVLSTFESQIWHSEEEWHRDLRRSSVRLQWDPDRSPVGGALARRAVQLGLRGDVLAAYAREWIVDIQDISDFVHEVREKHIRRRKSDRREWYEGMRTPRETLYPVADQATATRIRLTRAETPEGQQEAEQHEH